MPVSTIERPALISRGQPWFLNVMFALGLSLTVSAPAAAGVDMLSNLAVTEAGGADNCLSSGDDGTVLGMAPCSPSTPAVRWSVQTVGAAVQIKSVQQNPDGIERCVVNAGFSPKLEACSPDIGAQWLTVDAYQGHVQLRNAREGTRCLMMREDKVMLMACPEPAQPTALWSAESIPRLPPTPYKQTDLSAFPQPRHREFASLPSAESERLRLKQNAKWADWQPTGFYLNPFEQLDVSVNGNPGSAVLEMVVGTPAMVYPWDTQHSEPQLTYIPLNAGAQTITAPRGGLISIRYVTDSIGEKAPDLQVTLGEQAQPIPFWEQGKTTTQQWQSMLAVSSIPMAQMAFAQVIVTGTLQSAQACASDIEELAQLYTQGIAAQDRSAGLDGSTPMHQTSPLRPLIVETQAGVNPDSTDYRAAMPYPWLGVFCPAELKNDWGIWHEFGHQRQSRVMMWNVGSLGEVTVNIYTLATMHPWHPEGLPPRQPDATYWDKAVVYLHAPFDDREFENLTKVQGSITLSMFEQLRVAFGEQFYPRLERAIREHVDPMTEPLRKQMFQVQASKAAEHDLSDYFTAWGLRPDTATLEEIAKLQLPKPPTDPTKTPIFNGSNAPRLIDVWVFNSADGKLRVDGHAYPAGNTIEVLKHSTGKLEDTEAIVSEHLAFSTNKLDSSYLKPDYPDLGTLSAQPKATPPLVMSNAAMAYPRVWDLHASRQPDGSILLTGRAEPYGVSIQVHNQDGSWPPVARPDGIGNFKSIPLGNHHMEDGFKTFVIRMSYGERAFEERFVTELVDEERRQGTPCHCSDAAPVQPEQPSRAAQAGTQKTIAE